MLHKLKTIKWVKLKRPQLKDTFSPRCSIARKSVPTNMKKT